MPNWGITMTDLLTPEEVREMLVIIDEASNWPSEKTPRLCRDYLTLWDKYEDLKVTLIVADKLTQEIRDEFRGLKKDLEGRVLP